jgi:predicted metal-dependent HD superfamily phosphohydrolase
MKHDLHAVFAELLERNGAEEDQVQSLWEEIRVTYSVSYTHYHTLGHLDHIYDELLGVKDHIRDWDALLFALFYHDAVYEINGSHNEENSALLASERLHRLGVKGEVIDKVKNIILATKKHDPEGDMDANYFSDADASVLGGSLEAYALYLGKIRREFGSVSDVEFAKGRTREMRRFLAMPRIYKTEKFYTKYEIAARGNIRAELGGYKEQEA